MRRTLHLKKETLAEIGPDELRSVVGGPGTHILCASGLTYCEVCDDVEVAPLPTYTCTT